MTATKQTKIEMNAEIRTIVGGKVHQVRRSGYIPAVLYGKNQEPISLQVIEKDFAKTFHNAGESTLVYVNVDGQVYPTIIHDVARHPASDAILHADFYKVRLDQKIKTHVPVVFVGESQAVVDGGILVRNANELEVEALPTDLPHEISVDISKLVAFGDHIVLKDIDLGSKVAILGNPEEIIVTAQAPISEEELKASLETEGVTIDDVKVGEEREKTEEEKLAEVEGPAPVAEVKEKAKEKVKE